MINTREVRWLAGLLEGEGSFELGRHSKGPAKYAYPRIQLNMTDLDVVLRAADVLGATVHHVKPRQAHHLDQYGFCFQNRRTPGWMMTLYPLMGERRKTRIREVLSAWKSA